MKPTALVIGGGLYGCVIALELDALGYDTILAEKEADLLQRASYANQARVHQGYHYPRSILTALRSRQNFKSFVEEFPECIDNSFDKYYAIARRFSKVTANQFYQFSQRIGAPIAKAPQQIRTLFDANLIEEVFAVQEYAFDACILKKTLQTRLARTAVDTRLNTSVASIESVDDGFAVHLENDRCRETINAGKVFNCTYSNINRILESAGFNPVPLKHEHIEMALIEVPDMLNKVGITVMDGPFFSVMPFPSRNLHSLSHVRYTPHYQWADSPGAPLVDGYEEYHHHRPPSRHTHMILDAARYMPILKQATYRESLWEIKTILPQSETNDSRPILFRESPEAPGFFSVMGGKIDNVGDIRESLRAALGHG